MKNHPLSSIVTSSSERLFVADKNGKTVFFPWGPNKQGYYIKKTIAPKIKKFYKASFFVSFILMIFALSLLGNNFLGIVISMIICLGGWYFAYFYYVSRIIKSLPIAKASYKELILAKYEIDGTEEDSQEQSKNQFPAHWSKPIFQTNDDYFLGIKRIWYRLSPGQLFLFYFFAGVGIIIVSSSFIKRKFWESPIDFLIAFAVSALWGLAGFTVAQNIEGDNKDWWGFLNWKLPMILIAIICWSFAVYSLYKFIILIFV